MILLRLLILLLLCGDHCCRRVVAANATNVTTVLRNATTTTFPSNVSTTTQTTTPLLLTTTPSTAPMTTLLPYRRRRTRTHTVTINFARDILKPAKLFCVANAVVSTNSDANSTNSVGATPSLGLPLMYGSCCARELLRGAAMFYPSSNPFAKCNATLRQCLSVAKTGDGDAMLYNDSFGYFSSTLADRGTPSCADPLSDLVSCFANYQSCVITGGVQDTLLYNSLGSLCAWQPALVAAVRLSGAFIAAGLSYNSTPLFASCVQGLATQLVAFGCLASWVDGAAVVQRAIQTQCDSPAAVAAALAIAQSPSSQTSSASIASFVAASAPSVDDPPAPPPPFEIAFMPSMSVCQRAYCAESSPTGPFHCRCPSGDVNVSFVTFHAIALQAESQFDPCLMTPYGVNLCSPTARGTPISVLSTLAGTWGQSYKNCSRGMQTFTFTVVAPADGSPAAPPGTAPPTQFDTVTLCLPMSVTAFISTEAYPPTVPFSQVRTACYSPRYTASVGGPLLRAVCMCPDNSYVTAAPIIVVNTTLNQAGAGVFVLCNAPPQGTPVPPAAATAVVAASALIAQSAGAPLQQALMVNYAKCPPNVATRAASVTYTPSDIMNSPLRIGSEVTAGLYGHLAVHLGLLLLLSVAVVSTRSAFDCASLPQAYVKLPAQQSPFVHSSARRQSIMNAANADDDATGANGEELERMEDDAWSPRVVVGNGGRRPSDGPPLVPARHSAPRRTISAPTEAAMWLTRFPDMFLKVVSFYFLGVASEAASVLFVGMQGRFYDLIVLASIVLGSQVLFMLWVQRWAFVNHPHVVATEQRYAIAIAALPSDASIPFARWFMNGSAFLPKNFWDSQSVLSRVYSDLFATLRGEYAVKLTLMRFVVAIGIAFVSHGPITSAAACRAMLASVGAFFAFLAIFYAVIRPYRCPTDSVFACTMNAAAAVLSFARAFRLLDTNDVLDAMYVITGAACVVSLGITGMEFVVIRGIRREKEKREAIDREVAKVAADVQLPDRQKNQLWNRKASSAAEAVAPVPPREQQVGAAARKPSVAPPREEFRTRAASNDISSAIAAVTDAKRRDKRIR